MAAKASKVVVVTGANKGIGLEIVRSLAAREGLHVILTSRNPALGEAAVKELSAASLKVGYHQLDITESKSVDAFAEHIATTYDGGVDVLVNNAGFAFKGKTFGAEEAKQTLDVNYRGTKRVTEALLPFIKKTKGRVVNVASFTGKLSQVSDTLQTALGASTTTFGDLDKYADKFVEDIRAGRHKEEGWSNSMYGISKLFEIAYTNVLRNTLAATDPSVIAVSCCPGWCATDMSSHSGPKTAAAGAETPVLLATMPAPADGVPLFWTEGKPAKW